MRPRTSLPFEVLGEIQATRRTAEGPAIRRRVEKEVPLVAT